MKKLLTILLIIAGLAAVFYFYPKKSSTGLEDLIVVYSPKPNELVDSPLTFSGKARGQWYFEASFPVRLENAKGDILAQVPAQAQGEWMTTEFVPFEGTLEFSAPGTPTGKLIFERDNPSGLPENAASLEIPVRFIKR